MILHTFDDRAPARISISDDASPQERALLIDFWDFEQPSNQLIVLTEDDGRPVQKWMRIGTNMKEVN